MNYTFPIVNNYSKCLTRVIFLGLLLSLSACTSSALFLVNTMALTGDYDSQEHQFGDHEFNQLDLYVPSSRDSAESLPVVVFFYGGCWGGCETSNKEAYRFVAEALTSKGFLVVIADYRRYPEVRFPTIMSDATEATQWVVEHVEEYGGNPDRIFLSGHSAGAHIAATLVLDERYLSVDSQQRIRGFVGLAGPYDFLPFTKPYQSEVFGPQHLYPDSQPINFVDGKEPALMLLHGQDDFRVKPKNAINLAAKVREKGGDVEEIHYPGVDHSTIVGSLSILLRGSEPILEDIARFIKKH